MPTLPTDLLGDDNYFHWEFNMRMTLARKGLFEHTVEIKAEAERTKEWRVADMKALALIARGVQVQHQAKIRGAGTAMEAWGTLHDYYNRRNLHNRIALTRLLHEFKMEKGSSMSAHIDRFEELIVSMEAVGEPADEQRQTVVLLGIVPSEYDMLVSIVENLTGITLVEIKEKLLKEFAKLTSLEREHEAAFKAVQVHEQRPRFGSHRTQFRRRCFSCGSWGT